MTKLSRIKTITFDYRDWQNGYFISFEIPFTQEAYANVVAMPCSSNIRLHV